MIIIRFILIIFLILASQELAYGSELLPADSEEQYQSMIKSNREWEYVKKSKGFRDDDDWNYQLLRYIIKDPEICYGKLYYPIVLKETISWTEVDTSSNKLYSDFKIEPEGHTVGLIREEGAKVYILLESLPAPPPLYPCEPSNYENVRYYITFENGEFDLREIKSGDEAVLYDFSLEEGLVTKCVLRVCNVPQLSWFTVVSEVPVYSVSITTYNQRRFKEINVIDIPNIEFYKRSIGLDVEIDEENARYFGAISVEGVGNVGHGLLCEPGGALCDLDVAFPLDEYEMFNNLYDLEGNVIYPGRGVKAPPIAGDVITINDVEPVDDRYFDIMGRQSTDKEMVPGSVYIRGGKKFVAK